MDVDAIQADKVIVYDDPLAQHAMGNDYPGQWIAAAAQVHLQRRAAQNGDGSTNSGLIVLVQEQYASATQPVSILASDLLKEALAALGGMAAVCLGLWYFAFRGEKTQQYGVLEGESHADTLPSIHDRETLEQIPLPAKNDE